MIKNPTIPEFEAAVTMRVLLDRLVDPQRRSMARTLFLYGEALSQTCYAINDLLTEYGINRELWCRVRGRRAYIFHEPTGRIVAEVGVITDDARVGKGLRKRLKVELLGWHGRAIKSPTVGDMAVDAAKRGLSRHYQKKYKMHTKRKEAYHAS